MWLGRRGVVRPFSRKKDKDKGLRSGKNPVTLIEWRRIEDVSLGEGQ